MSKEGARALLYSVLILPIIGMYLVPLIHYIILRIRRTIKARQTVTQRMPDTEESVEAADEGEVDAKEEFNQDISCRRIYSMHWNVWIIIWLIYYVATAGLEESENVYYGVKRFTDYYGIPHILLFIVFLYIEPFKSWEWQYLSNIITDKTCRSYIKELVDARPSVRAVAVAWHYEIRRFQTTTYLEKVEDDRQSEFLHITRWEDVSSDPDSLTGYANNLTRLRMLKSIVFSNNETEAAFNRIMEIAVQKVRERNPGLDIDTSREDSIPGFEERVLAYWESYQPKWWFNKSVFILATFLLMTWVYRIVFAAKTQKAGFKIVKNIYADSAYCNEDNDTSTEEEIDLNADEENDLNGKEVIERQDNCEISVTHL